MNPIPTHSHRKATEEAAYNALAPVNAAMGYLVIAMKHGNPDTATLARQHLVQALAFLDTVAVDSATFEGAAV